VIEDRVGHLTQIVRLIGPNCPGILSPGAANVGNIPAAFLREGKCRLGLAFRHAYLPDRQRARAERLWQADDRRHRRPGAGTDFIDVIGMFQEDADRADPKCDIRLMLETCDLSAVLGAYRLKPRFRTGRVPPRTYVMWRRIGPQNWRRTRLRRLSDAHSRDTQSRLATLRCRWQRRCNHARSIR